MSALNVKIFNFLAMFLGISIFLTLLWEPNFGVLEDHTIVQSLQQGLLYPLQIGMYQGRFSPLLGQEFNLIALIKPDVFLYFLFIALQWGVFCLVTYSLLRKFTGNRHFAALGLVLLMLTPGAIGSWFRIIQQDRGVVFYGALSVWFYFRSIKKSKSINIDFWITLFFANICIYYKESGFIFVLLFAFVQWLKSRRLIDLALVMSSVLFLIIYFFGVIPNITAERYGVTQHHLGLMYFKTVFSYSLSNPFLMFWVFPYFLIRVRQVIIKRSKIREFEDSFLAASSGYFLALIVLNLHQPYYLVAADWLGLMAVAFFIKRKGYQGLDKLVRTVAIGIGTIYFTNVVPLGLHLGSFMKYVPIHYQKTISFLDEYLKSRNHLPNKTRILLFGVDKKEQIEVYVSFKSFLKASGHDESRYDLSAVEDLSPGDLVVYTPYSLLSKTDTRYLKIQECALQRYRSESLFGIPRLHIKNLIKRIILEWFPLENAKYLQATGVITATNLETMPDFEILEIQLPCKI